MSGLKILTEVAGAATRAAETTAIARWAEELGVGGKVAAQRNPLDALVTSPITKDRQWARLTRGLRTDPRTLAQAYFDVGLAWRNGSFKIAIPAFRRAGDLFAELGERERAGFSYYLAGALADHWDSGYSRADRAALFTLAGESLDQSERADLAFATWVGAANSYHEAPDKRMEALAKAGHALRKNGNEHLARLLLSAVDPEALGGEAASGGALTAFESFDATALNTDALLGLQTHFTLAHVGHNILHEALHALACILRDRNAAAHGAFFLYLEAKLNAPGHVADAIMSGASWMRDAGMGAPAAALMRLAADALDQTDRHPSVAACTRWDAARALEQSGNFAEAEQAYREAARAFESYGEADMSRDSRDGARRMKKKRAEA